MKDYIYNKQLKEIGVYDCVVIGSGASGIAAAVSSARMGVKTLMVERYGVIGGNLTVGHVGPIMGSTSQGTISDEVRQILNTKGHDEGHDFEMAKIILTEWVEKSGVEVLLQTPVVDVIKEGVQITGIIVATREGLGVIYGKVFIDATGDGQVAYLSDCEYDMGREIDQLMQPTTLMFTISNVDETCGEVCRHEEDDFVIPKGSYLAWCRKMAQSGELPENVTIVRMYKTNKPGERIINATQANKIDATKLNEITQAEFNLRKQIEMVYNFLVKYVPCCKEATIRVSASTLGVRETRRVKGEYTITIEDLMKGEVFPDSIVHQAFFSIDIHNPDGGGQAESEGLPPVPQPYDIPYRSLVPIKVDGLILSGRNISGTHHAHASYRVMNIAIAIGQASGIAAALCIKENTSPRLLDHKKIQKQLVNLGVNLFN